MKHVEAQYKGSATNSNAHLVSTASSVDPRAQGPVTVGMSGPVRDFLTKPDTAAVSLCLVMTW